MNSQKMVKKLETVFQEAGFVLEKIEEMDTSCCGYTEPCFGFFTKEFGAFFVGLANFDFTIEWNNVEQALLWKNSLSISFSGLFMENKTRTKHSIQVFDLDEVRYTLLLIKEHIDRELERQKAKEK